jgi:hydrogenase expression/formation protein HypD
MEKSKEQTDSSFSSPNVQILRNLEFTKKLLDKINLLMQKIGRTVKVMHVCGTHEHVLCENGLRTLLPKALEIVSGPGCPVCVCPAIDIDRAIVISQNKNVILTTFGDMIRVPSSHKSLMEQKAAGSDIRIVYGPSDAIRIARENPSKEVVFFSIGFETTAPLPAFELASNPPSNFSIICANKTIPPAMELITSMPDVQIDGFITPGHVAAIIGTKPFDIFSDAYRYPNVVTGFEPGDLLLGTFLLLKQIEKKEAKTVNEYSRVVKPEGNLIAQNVMNKVFKSVTSPWRGIGRISDGGLELRDEYQKFDALKRFNIEIKDSRDIPLGCSCHLVLTGKIKPEKCKLFGKSCTPINPIGPCMVSHEGTCKIAYTFKDTSFE